MQQMMQNNPFSMNPYAAASQPTNPLPFNV
jgi:hypothetical protein